MGARITAKAAPLAVAADSTADLETSTVSLLWQQATGKKGKQDLRTKLFILIYFFKLRLQNNLYVRFKAYEGRK